MEYVGFKAGDCREGLRVIVLIEAMMRAEAEQRSALTSPSLQRLCQYWTLGFRDGPYTVLDIEERTEGDHHLVEPIGAPSGAAR